VINRELECEINDMKKKLEKCKSERSEFERRVETKMEKIEFLKKKHEEVKH